MSGESVSQRLVGFIRAAQSHGVPETVRHEANRLLVNQLKASIGAVSHQAVRILRDWAGQTTNADAATLLWFGTKTLPERACMVNAALFEVLDFNETHIPTFQHAVSGVLPAALATAEMRCSSGSDLLDALALGIEAELAIATILMPTGYYRGFVPGGITGAVGAAIACGMLLELDDTRLQNAIGLAMNAGLGCYQSAGSMALPFIMGRAAGNGLLAAELAAAGMDAPALAFEGDKGMLQAYSDEKPEKIEGVLAELGQSWRILRQSYKTVPTETITHGPIEAILALRARAPNSAARRIRLGVAAIVVTIAEERAVRFGAPRSDLEARFDLRYCAAAAWHRGRFSLAEMQPEAYTDPAILELRDNVELAANPELTTFEGASATIDYADGSTDTWHVPAFRGTPGNPLSDDELSAVFRAAAAGILAPERADLVLQEAWSLPNATNLHALLNAARVN